MTHRERRSRVRSCGVRVGDPPRWRGHLIFIVSSAILSGLYFVGQQIIAHSDFWAHVSSHFSVRETRWIGLVHLKSPDMEKRFQYLSGAPMLHLDMRELRDRVEREPWVKVASIRKDLPGRLTFFITERRPAAVEWIGTSETFLRDEEGVILQKGQGNKERLFHDAFPNLPRITHFDAARYPQALLLASLLSDRAGLMVDMIHSGDLVVYLPEVTLHFGMEDYEARWNAFEKIESDLARRVVSHPTVDLRFSGMVVVETL